MEEAMKAGSSLLTIYGLKVIGAILIIGRMIANWAKKQVEYRFEQSATVDQTLKGFVSSFVRYLVLIVTFLAVISQFGVETHGTRLRKKYVKS